MSLDGSGITIVGLQPQDWRQLWELKLRSLKQEPIAFEDPDEACQRFADRSEAEWQAILSGKMSGGRDGKSINVFAKDTDQGKLVGMVSSIIPADQKTGNITATMQHLFVDQVYRGTGIGGRLLNELINQLKGCCFVDRVELWVVTTQLSAIRMYRRFDFRETSNVKRGIKRAHTTCDEQEMVLLLRDWK